MIAAKGVTLTHIYTHRQTAVKYGIEMYALVMGSYQGISASNDVTIYRLYLKDATVYIHI